MTRTALSVFLAATLLVAAAPVVCLSDNVVAAGDCPPLTREEAASILGGMVDNVAGVAAGPIPGFWEVDAGKGGKVYPLYLDCSRKYVFHGQFFRLSDMRNVTRLRYMELNRVDVSAIPLKNAVVLGKSTAAKRIIVLTDPTCPYCVKLHPELKKAAAADPDVAFYVMPYPRNPNDKATYAKCLAIVCAKSAKLLDDAYAGKELPAPSCKSDAVTETIRLAQQLQIEGTPTLVLPDGRIVSGYMDSATILSLLR
jgi:thiol:disulfide interchange protein DsbC